MTDNRTIKAPEGMLAVWRDMYEWARKNGGDMPCPRCGRRTMTDHNAISRRVSVEICPACGEEEAFEDYATSGRVDDVSHWWLFSGSRR